MYAATVAKVVDGDTLDLVVDLGFGTSHKIRARLVGVYAPELGAAEGKGEQAAEFTRAWAAEHGPVLTVRTFRDRKERYGRYLATITSADGASLGEALVAAGHATTAP
ncbi:thermonuclease family protein [Nonomuraea recticatena]|uniref:thermonuclease family protein n=1 Tax=Nonomuraea recticatena TaxID=46178 RepID=UPI00361A6743